jgi:pimeloyl-ACP methyl ester carboxylesterase
VILLFGAVFLFYRVELRELDDSARSQAGGSYLDLDQGTIHYYLEGPTNAPLVVFIHGFSVPSYVWETTTSFLNEKGFRTLRFDLYGRGFSDRPDLEYSISLFTEQLAGLVQSLQGDAPVAVVGLSMGGPIAARYAHQHPDQVQAVVLISPEVTQTSSGDIFPLNLPGIGEVLMVGVMEPLVLPKLQADDFIHPENYPDWESSYREQLQYKGTGRALLSTIRALVQLNPEGEYKALEEAGLPVLLMWGEADRTIGRDQIDVLRQILPGMEIWTLEGAGHLLHYERPAAVNPVLLEFLERIQ